MRLFSGLVTFFCFFAPYGLSADAVGGDLTVINATDGRLLRVTVTRGGSLIFDNALKPVDPRNRLEKAAFLEGGDQINLPPADGISGIILTEDCTVGMLYGRPENITINCTEDQCSVFRN